MCVSGVCVRGWGVCEGGGVCVSVRGTGAGGGLETVSEGREEDGRRRYQKRRGDTAGQHAVRSLLVPTCCSRYRAGLS